MNNHEHQAKKRPNAMQPNKNMVNSVALYVVVPMPERVTVAFLFHISTAYISLARNKTISLVLSAWKKLKLEFSQTSVLWLIKPRSRSQELPCEPKLDCFSNTLIVTLNQFERLGVFFFSRTRCQPFFFSANNIHGRTG